MPGQNWKLPVGSVSLGAFARIIGRTRTSLYAWWESGEFTPDGIVSGESGSRPGYHCDRAFYRVADAVPRYWQSRPGRAHRRRIDRQLTKRQRLGREF
jgi:hypothetical protein